MKKLLLFLFIVTSAFYANAQINVAFQVDVSRLVAGTSILPAGMRIAGNFGTLNASVLGIPMVDWTPGDTTGKLINLGGNVWGTVITFPAMDANTDTLQFKFINGTWGTNESYGGADDTLIKEGCAPASGVAQGNRLLPVPAITGQTFKWCYDHCVSCEALQGAPPVTVNFQVDVTRLLAGGTQILPAGMRIAGNFGDLKASILGVPMVNWTPGDTTGHLINLGGNVWGTAITFPDSDAVKHDTLQFKFINGTWGTNEGGTNGDDTLIQGGCAPAGGAAQGNRLLAIPSTSGQTFKWCYDHCVSCEALQQTPVTVNFQVDVTRLLAGGTQILPAGMRVAGNFGALHASVAGNAMVDWTPGDTTGRLTNLGSNVWGTTVSFPDSDAVKHDTLQFKFINGTWGTNEGGANGDDTLIQGGCAPAGGAAKGNRLLAIPATSGQTLKWCYDHCATCEAIQGTPVTVTFQVDVTRLLAGGAQILPAGMRIAGNFGTVSASVNGTAMVDWTPGDTTGRLTNLGNNIWGTTVSFPAGDANKDTLQFKFINGTWGTNEANGSDDTLIQEGCSPASGAAKGNRLFVIPATGGQTFKWCYDHCVTCEALAPPGNTVNVTFQVDISRLAAANVPILPAGMRVAGNFGTLGATVNGKAMVDWAPGDTSSRLINMGNNVWATTIAFPTSDADNHDTLQFKFVDGTWYSTGTNENANTDDSLIQGGCSPASGPAKGNRLFVIPSTDGQIYQWCYDHCTRCDGTPAQAIITTVPAVNNKATIFSLAPNPAVNGQSTLMYSVNEYSQVNISLYNVLGQQVKTFVNTNRPSGIYNQTIDVKGFSSGVYFIRLKSGAQTITRRIVL